MKKLLIISVFTGFFIALFITESNYLSHQNFELINSNFVSLNLFDTRDFSNTQYHQNNLLKQLFVEKIYLNFVLEELESFKSITVLLLKKFVNFWFITETFKILLEKVVYLFTEIRKLFIFNCIVLFNLVLPIFIFLFYFKTQHKTFKLPNIVLRC